MHPTQENGPSTSTKVGRSYSNWGTCKLKGECCVQYSLITYSAGGTVYACEQVEQKIRIIILVEHPLVYSAPRHNIDVRYTLHLFVTGQFVLHNDG